MIWGHVVVLQDNIEPALGADQTWHSTFVPHALLLTEKRAPEPIFVATYIHPEKMLRIDVDVSQPPESFPAQVLAECRNRNADMRVPAFGRVTGFVVNETPDRAMLYNRDGQLLHILNKAHRYGRRLVSIEGEVVTPPSL